MLQNMQNMLQNMQNMGFCAKKETDRQTDRQTAAALGHYNFLQMVQ
jgi:hypothetical protein